MGYHLDRKPQRTRRQERCPQQLFVARRESGGAGEGLDKDRRTTCSARSGWNARVERLARRPDSHRTWQRYWPRPFSLGGYGGADGGRPGTRTRAPSAPDGGLALLWRRLAE